MIKISVIGDMLAKVMDRMGSIENLITARLGTTDTVISIDTRLTNLEAEVGAPEASRIDTIETNITSLMAGSFGNLTYVEKGTSQFDCTENNTWNDYDLSALIAQTHPKWGLFEFSYASDNLADTMSMRAYGSTPTYNPKIQLSVVNKFMNYLALIKLDDNKKVQYICTTAGTDSGYIRLIGYWYGPS